MNDVERELWEALQELLCCPAFNGKVFMADGESHRAWTLAREVAERHRPPPIEERRGIQLSDSQEIGPSDKVRCTITPAEEKEKTCPECEKSWRGNLSVGLCPYCGEGLEMNDIPDFLKRQAE